MTNTVVTREVKTSLLNDKLPYEGGTEAYRRFAITNYRTRTMLQVSIKGIESEVTQHDLLLGKFNSAINPTTVDSNDQQIQMFNEDGEPVDEKGERLIKVDFSNDEMQTIIKALNHSRDEHLQLDKYFYSILIVFCWGTFETYLYHVFSELFRKKPAMLKTEGSSFSTNEILDNLEDPLQLLISKEMRKIGHFRINDWKIYLNKQIKYDFDEEVFNKLSKVYLVRNIIAHNTGVVRLDQMDLIPEELEVDNGELVINKEYLLSSIILINKVVVQMETHIRGKYYKEE